MPTIFELFGLRFFFFSEDHAPIHVHVVKGDDDAKYHWNPSSTWYITMGLNLKI